jgi:hypothetical protein
VPLSDGHFGLCRVLRTATEDERQTFGECILVATSSWRGSAPPDLDDPALREILRKTHHAWSGQLDVHFTADAAPPEYRLLGKIPPNESDLGLTTNALGRWSSDIQVTAQWRWDHDREALLAEEAEEARMKANRAAEEKRREEQRRSELAWEKLRTKTRFPTWPEHLGDDVVVASRQLFIEAVDGLATAGSKSGKRKARAVIRALVEGFNRLDEEHGHFIETVEREEICEEVADVALLAGLPPNVADEWREW